jgi:OPT family oligopeptide transporter
MAEEKEFKPYIADGTILPEFTLRAVVLGCIFGVIFGAANVYLALKAGLTVSASIPIAVLAISLGRKFMKTSILENNIIQTTGSAGESIASGVVFTLPAFLFLSADAHGEVYFNYWTILSLAVIGGLLGTLMMIPLRRSLIVKEHGKLPYPEGTACAQVLIAGDKGGDFAKTAYLGLAAATVYAFLQRVFHVIADTPSYLIKQTNKFMPSARIDLENTPEYLGVGYIIGPKISGQLVAGGVLAWLGLIPLLAFLLPADTIALQQVKLGFLQSLQDASGGYGGWDPIHHIFADPAEAVYRAYIRQIGAGCVAAGGFITLFKTLPTIITSFREGLSSMKNREVASSRKRTERDLSLKVTLIGCAVLVIIIALLPNLPTSGVLGKLLIGVLVIIFGFFFVTVSSRIVGIIGSSNSPVSGMTIATIMGTSLVFIAFGLTGKAFEPLVLVVGSLICIAAANAGNTSQDLKTGYLIGATPRSQQLALFIGAIVSTFVVGFVVKILDTPTPDQLAHGIHHAIGTTFNAPQGTLMATLIKGLLSFNLDWQFVMVGVFLAITVELMGVNSLSFAVGAYLPLSTTLPIFAGGCIKGAVDWRAKRKNEEPEEGELGRGSLFATGLVAGGALMGVIVAILVVIADNMKMANSKSFMDKMSLQEVIVGTDPQHGIGMGMYSLFGVLFFAGLAYMLYRVASKKA